MKRIYIGLSTGVLIILLLMGCQSDHGLEPTRSGISGKISYVGDWPENTAEVRIVAATSFPPNSVEDLIIGDMMPIGGDSTEYNFWVNPGDYYLGLVWRGRDSAWGIQSIFAIYFEPGETFMPGVITVPDKQTVVAKKDMVADFSRARIASESAISGTLFFEGEWPENVEEVRVIASSKSIMSPSLSLLDLSFSGSLSAYQDSLDYEISVSPDTYKTLAVLIKIQDQEWSIENVVGLYLNPVEVPTETSHVDGVDFTVTFRSNP